MSDKHALITGITGNVGEACWNKFEETYQVFGVSRKAGLVPGFIADLSSPLAIKRIAKKSPRYDLVIMAHGIQETASLSDRTYMLTYHEIVDNNLTACVSLTHALLAADRLADGALVVYCSSIQATQTRAGRSAYAIAKAGVEALARSLTVESGGKVRGVALRLGQLTKTMQGVTFTVDQLQTITGKLDLPLVSPDEVAELIMALTRIRSLTGVIDFDSGHHVKIWD
jgi:NADP-dependent 3-hydroxy acid dehydrogenase YdfG